MTPRYVVTEANGFIAGDGTRVRVFAVTRTNGGLVNGRPGDPAVVWAKDQDGIQTNCTICSGALHAMLSSCRHCEAVKRFLARNK